MVDLANAGLNITIADENQVGYKMLARSGATPLFRGIRLKRTWLRKIKFEEADVGSRSEQQIDEMFEPVSPGRSGGRSRRSGRTTMPWDRQALIRVREILARLYPTERESRRVVATPG